MFPGAAWGGWSTAASIVASVVIGLDAKNTGVQSRREGNRTRRSVKRHASRNLPQRGEFRACAHNEKAKIQEQVCQDSRRCLVTISREN